MDNLSRWSVPNNSKLHKCRSINGNVVDIVPDEHDELDYISHRTKVCDENVSALMQLYMYCTVYIVFINRVTY